MIIAEIKKWAKEYGYTIRAEKLDDGTKKYYWHKNEEPSISGVEPSVSKVATAVYNNITGNKWLDYQTKYKENLNQNFEINRIK